MDFPQNYRKNIIKLIVGLSFLGLLFFLNENIVFGALFALFLCAVAFLAFDFLGIKSRLFYIIFITTIVFSVGIVFVFYYSSDAVLSSLVSGVFNAWLLSLMVVIGYKILLELGISRLVAFIIAMASALCSALFLFRNIVFSQAGAVFLVILFLCVRLTKKFTSNRL